MNSTFRNKNCFISTNRDYNGKEVICGMGFSFQQICSPIFHSTQDSLPINSFNAVNMPTNSSDRLYSLT